MQESTGGFDQLAGIIQRLRVFKPGIPARAQRSGVIAQPFLQWTCHFHAGQRAIGGLRGLADHIVQAVAGVRKSVGDFHNRLLQPEVSHAVAQHTGQLPDANENLSGVIRLHI